MLVFVYTQLSLGDHATPCDQAVHPKIVYFCVCLCVFVRLHARSEDRAARLLRDQAVKPNVVYMCVIAHTQ